LSDLVLDIEAKARDRILEKGKEAHVIIASVGSG
jgi:hypothetical protein